MSLVYDALKQQADPAAPVRPAPPRASWWARQAPKHRGGVLLAAGALVAAPLAFFAASALDGGHDAPAVASPLQAERAVPKAEMSAAAAATSHVAAADVEAASEDKAAAVTAAAAVALIATEDDAVAPVVDASTAQAGTEHAASEAPAPTPAAAVAAAPSASRPGTAAAIEPSSSSTPINITVAQRAIGSAQGATDHTAVEQSVRNIESAIAAGDVAGARQALATLETVLHADSLTLLRMRAWVAHGGEDMDAAEDLYRQIAGRVPDDLNAGVNIALLDARRGDIDDARSRLRRLSGRHARSPQLARALAELDALPR